MKNRVDPLIAARQWVTPKAAQNPQSSDHKQNLGIILTIVFCLFMDSSASATIFSWTGASGSDSNWTTAGNWDLGTPTNGADVFFTPVDDEGAANFTVGGGTPNNVVNSNFTLDSFWTHPTNAWQVTQIPLGTTLSITGSMPNTMVSLGTDNYAIWVGAQINQSMYHTIEGQGTLSVSNPNAMVMVRNTWSAFQSSTPTLDLSGLNTFTANIIGISVGGEGTTTASTNDRPTGVLYLAQTNIIISPSTLQLRPSSLSGMILTIGDSIVSTGPTSYVYLGNTNVFLGNTGIGVGWRRGMGSLSFNPNSVNGVAYFRNMAGTGTQSYWGIGDNFTGNTGFTSTGLADFTGGTVDAMVDQMYVGRSGTSTTSAAVGTGTLLIGNGIINVNTLNISVQRTGNNVGYGVGTVTTSGVTITNLVVNSNLNLGTTISGGGVASTSGTLNINSCVTIAGSIVCGVTPNTTLTLNGGSLTVGGTIGQSSSATTGAINNLNLNSGVLNLSLGTAGNPNRPICNASNLNVNGITLNLTGAGISPGVIPVMEFYNSGSFSGITYGTLPPKVYGYYSNSVNTLYLVVTNVDSPKWTGKINGNWDTTTSNWVGGISDLATTYQQAIAPADTVLFDDTATGMTTVDLTTNLTPTAITVNNSSLNYTFNGSGEITGATGLNKQGTSKLVLANTGTNTFTGSVTIGGGDVQLSGSANILPTNAIVTLNNLSGVVLDLNGQSQQLGGLTGGGTTGGNVTLGSGTLTISGTGSEFDGTISGPGSVIKTGSGTQIFGGANTYGGGTIISNGTLIVVNSSGSGIGNGNLLIAGGTLQIGNAGTSGSIAQTIITNNGTLALDRSDDILFTNFVAGSGGLTHLSTDTVTIPGSNSYSGTTLISDGAISIYSPGALGNSNGTVSISSAQLARVELSSNITLTHPIIVSSKSGSFNAPPHVENLNGTNILSGAISGAGGGTDWSFQSDSGELIVTGTFTNSSVSVSQNLDLRGNSSGVWYPGVGNGASPSYVVQLLKLDSGTWTITPTSTNTYTGPTTISSGALVMNGAILNSSGVQVSAGATLAGSGFINSPVNIAFGGTLSPENGGIGSPTTMTISNTLSFGPDTTCVINITSTGYDSIAGLSTVTYAGTLQINTDGTLQENGVFKLFAATNFVNGFDSINLPTLPGTLTWDTSYLTVDGTLRITGGPAVTSFGLGSGSDFQMSGTGSPGQPYRIMATTNVALPFSSWTQVSSGTFTGGVFSFTDTSTTNYTRRFYRVVSP